MTRTPKLSVGLVAAIVALTACGGPAPSEPSLAPVPVPVAPVEAAPPPLEGPVTEPAVFPGGVTAEIVSVEIGPSPEPYAAVGEGTWVTVTTQLSSSDEYPVGDWGPQGTLRYGPAQMDAPKYATEDSSGDFQLIPPGSPVTYVEEFTLPTEVDPSGISYEFTPAAEYEPTWTFTGVEDLAGS